MENREELRKKGMIALKNNMSREEKISFMKRGGGEGINIVFG
jgi:hypothetical protein